MTALMFAVKVGSFDVVKLLVENSANLFAQNSVSLPPVSSYPITGCGPHGTSFSCLSLCALNTLLM